MALITIDDLKKVPGFVFYGYGGAGKPTLAKQAAEAVGWERTLWLQTDRPVDNFEPPVYTDREPFGVVDLLDEPMENVVKAVKRAQLAAKTGKYMYDLVVLDSISMSERVNMDAIESGPNAPRDGRKLWGIQGGDTQELVWTLRAGQRLPKPRYLGAITILSDFYREVSDADQTKNPDGTPNTNLHPSVRGEWGLLIDHHYNGVFYMTRTPAGRQVYLKPEGRIHTKNDWEHTTRVPKLILPDAAKGNGFVELLKTLNLLKEGAK
jgi:hypothetical protein